MARKNYSILIMDDDPDVLRTLEVVLGYYYTRVHTERHIAALEEKLSQNTYDLIILDMNFHKGQNSGNEGLFWLKKIKKSYPDTPVILITAYGEVELAVEAMKFGAADFLLKPWSNEKLLGVVKKSLPRKGRKETKQTESFLFGQSPAMLDLLKSIEKIAATDANVLLLGENGTGKSSLAQLIHQQSERRDRPFVSSDLGALDDQLMASTLFGHLKGAFTDAREDRQGLFQTAHEGTLFLDEIANLSLANQAKLLRVLQDRKVRKLGSHEEEAI
nr:sigma 54-interacting transcriptional regulator [Saprospiraceae bacterium]